MAFDAAATVGAAAQIDDPSVLFELSGAAYAGLSFLLMLAAGAVLLRSRPRAVDRTIDRSVEGSRAAVAYGPIPFLIVGFVGGYVPSQAARVNARFGTDVGIDGRVLAWTWAAVVGLAMATLAGLGYLVVGTVLTGIEGRRRPWHGTVVGATLSALPWLVLPTLPAAIVWFLVAAVGLGGPTHHWVHGERTVESETGGRY